MISRMLLFVGVLALLLFPVANAEKLRVVFTNVMLGKGYLVALLVDGKNEWQEIMSSKIDAAFRDIKTEVGNSRRQEVVFEGLVGQAVCRKVDMVLSPIRM